MAHIEKATRGRSAGNEDFIFEKELPTGHAVVVGDFAPSTHEGINEMAVDELEKIIGDTSLAHAGMQALLAHTAAQFNIRLLTLHEGLGGSFQCCAVFAAISGDRLYYLPVGDCRISVRRGDALILLNGSLWAKANGHALPSLVTTQQEDVRAPDKGSERVLGVYPVEYKPAEVEEFPLERDDVVLLYSDGVDKVVSPARLLSLMKGDGAGASYADFAERVMTEIENLNGDDDRTLLIAAGPHSSGAEEVFETALRNNSEAQQTANTRLEGLEQRMDSVGQQVNSVGELQRQVESVEGYFRAIQDRIDALPTHREIMDALTSARGDSATAAQLVSLNTKLDEMLKELRQRPDTPANNTGIVEEKAENTSDAVRAAAAQQQGGRGPSVKQQQQQSANAGKTTAAGAAKAQPAGKTTSGPSIIDPALHFREGVLRITKNEFRLIDEADVLPGDLSGGDERGLYLAPPPERPAGWFTAWYLYLRAMLPAGSYSKPGENMRRIVEYPTPELENLRGDELLRLRGEHQRIRDRRRRAAWFGRGRVDKRERVLAAEVARQLGKEPQYTYSRPSAAVRFLWGVRDFIEMHILLVVGIAVFAVFAVVGMFLMGYWGDNKPSTNSTAQPTPTALADNAIVLDYGADGRMLVLAVEGRREPLGYRIQPGKEEDFKRKFENIRFASKEEAMSRLKSESRSLLAQPGELLTLPAGQTIYAVETQDTSGDICTRFLERVNKRLPSGVHADLAELKTLNPGLKCEKLQTGDELLVYSARR